MDQEGKECADFPNRSLAGEVHGAVGDTLNGKVWVKQVLLVLVKG